MKSAARLVTLLGLCALPALAEGPGFGAQVGLVGPQGDLKDGVDSKVGYTAGIHICFDLGKDWRLRPRLDYLAFPERKQTYSYYDPYLDVTTQGSSSSKITGWSIGLDGQYFLAEKHQGLFLLGGIGLISWKSEGSGTIAMVGPGGTVSDSMSESQTWTKACFVAGAGYQFNRRVALEGRYVISKIGDESASANTLQVAATFRF